MNNKLLISQRFSRYASRYDAIASFQRVIAGRVMERAVRMGVQGRVLDIGCGTGQIAAQAAGHGWDTLQLDLAPAMCRIARAHAPAVAGDAEALPFADACMDHAVSSLAWQWFPQPGLAFAEARRVVRHGGTLVLATLVEGTLKELRHAFAAFDDTPRIHAFASVEAVEQAARDAGWHVAQAGCTVCEEPYADVRALLHAIRGIGAASTLARPTFTSRRIFERLEGAYPRREDGIRASWAVLDMVLEAR